MEDKEYKQIIYEYFKYNDATAEDWDLMAECVFEMTEEITKPEVTNFIKRMLSKSQYEEWYG